MSISFPNVLWIALILAALVGTALVLRRGKLPRITVGLFILGSLCLALSAADLVIQSSDGAEIVVMIDNSASTRTAGYHNRNILQARIEQLVARRPYRIVEFSDDAADHTEFAPPDSADAVLLFSDVRFETPLGAAAVFVVVDPNLEEPADASITHLEFQGEKMVTAAIRNHGMARSLVVNDNTAHPTTIPAALEVQLMTIDVDASQPVHAHLLPADAWPENDGLTFHRSRPEKTEKWWLGDPPVEMSAEWRVLSPSNLPNDLGDYLSPSVIVLSNIPADALSAVRQARLVQFVRELGGGLIIVGGNHAFAAGDYVGSTIEALSPLASSPQNPQREWLILVDSSGSMATPADDGTSRWQHASAVAAQILSHLPPNDSVNIGSFARDLRFWTPAAAAGEISKQSLPPRDINPQGPTNLDSILQQIAGKLEPGARKEVILITDADTKIGDAESLADRFRNVNARVHLLAIGKEPNATVRNLSILTDGQFAAEVNPSDWATALRQLFLNTLSDRLGAFPVTINFEKELAVVLSRSAGVWNRTWLKDRATLLATADDSGSRAPMAARWQLGAGGVVAAAFPATMIEANALANLVAKKPRDPRFKVSWRGGQKLSVSVHAAEGNLQMNNLDLSLVTADEDDSTRNVHLFKLLQTAPGQYETSVPAPRSPVLVTIRLKDQTIEHFAVAGRYAAEFEAIGNDHDAMRDLANRSGGAVINPSQTSAIAFPAKPRRQSLLGILAACGAGCIAIGLIAWKKDR